MTELNRKQKIELINQLIQHKRDINIFQEKFDELFGVGHGFPGASDGSFNVFNKLFDAYSAHVAEKIGATKTDIDWFMFENECGENGMNCGFDGNEFQIKSAEDFIRFLNLCNEKT